MIKVLLAMILLCGGQSLQNDFVKYSVRSHNKKVVCYFGSWANYRPGAGKFTPEHVDASLCTHLVYSFAGLNPNTSEIMSLDPWLDLEENYGLAGFRKATDLKINHPALKVTLAIGGWNEGSVTYSKMARNATSRATFVKSTIKFLVKHKFDGLDVDWEYPGKRGGLPDDNVNFIALIRDLKRALNAHKMILTAAIGASPETIEAAYDIPEMYKYLDYVHVMCYDYHGQWDRKTGHNAPLYPMPDEDKSKTVDATIKLLLRMGAVREKTVLGLAFYGRAFLLSDSLKNWMNADAGETSFSGPYTREDGFMGYHEICEELTVPGSGWRDTMDPFQESPYMWNERKWISYDNEQSLRKKSEYSYDFDLAGVMIWSIDTDDFTGTCTGQRFPLLRAINNALYMRYAKLSGQRPHTPAGASTLMTSSLLIFIAAAAILFSNFHRV